MGVEGSERFACERTVGQKNGCLQTITRARSCYLAFDFNPQASSLRPKVKIDLAAVARGLEAEVFGIGNSCDVWPARGIPGASSIDALNRWTVNRE
jgi:hypothetical protein